MTRADRVLIAALSALALVAWPLAVAAASQGGDAVITGPYGTSTLSLAEDTEVEIQGASGTVVVRVADRRVCVVTSDCPDHTCMKTGYIGSGGSVVACVPNRVVVSVEGGSDGEYDARIR
jgi:hypothetical protein